MLVRIAIEVWTSRAATSVLAVSALAYIAAITYDHHPEPGVGEQSAVVISTAALLSAHFGLLYTVVCFARHVYLEAQGERRSRSSHQPKNAARAKPSRSTMRAKKSLTTKQQAVRVDSAHEAKNTPAKKQPAAQAKKRVVSAKEPKPEVPMSKSERRRLRKLERRQKRMADESDT